MEQDGEGLGLLAGEGCRAGGLKESLFEDFGDQPVQDGAIVGAGEVGGPVVEVSVQARVAGAELNQG